MGSTRGPTKKKKKSKTIHRPIQKKKKKTVETQTAVQKEQKHPAAVTTIKLCLKSFLIITKRRLV